MIAIDDVQLTPKRVPVGGNFLLRVLAHYMDGGDDVTITTQDVPLAWTLLEEAKIMYAPLDVDGDTFARILGAYSTNENSDGAILKAPGVFSLAGVMPIYMYLGQLYGASIGDGYCVIADLRDVYAVGGAATDVAIDFYDGTFTQARLYILGE